MPSLSFRVYCNGAGRLAVQRELAGALAGHADAELAAARAEAAVALQRLAALEQRVEASSARALAELEAMRAQTVSALCVDLFRF